jgi:DNA-binding CsgD family transcriptional regulator
MVWGNDWKIKTRYAVLCRASFAADPSAFARCVPSRAMRLRQVGRIGKGAVLTARELAVLRLLSIGNPMREVADLLELGGETVRSHLKKAQAKLGVHDRTHAVAQAIRQRLIP